MKVLIVPDKAKEEAGKASLEIADWLRNNSISPLFSLCDEQKPDFAILLGGDGFIMRESLNLAGYDIPFLGINFGTKGFLAVAEKDNWHDVLKKVIDGKYIVERRVVLEVSHFGKRKVKKHFEAAGNVYIRHKTDLILVNIAIDGQSVYRNLPVDGVIVATPTGATGYNLGAGGPIISSGMVIRPICPHALNVASLPVPESKKVEIVYLGRKSNYGRDGGCLLHTDSGRWPIKPGDRVEVRSSQKEASFIIPEGFSFFEALQGKLGLSK